MVKLFKGNQEYEVAQDSEFYKELKEKGFLVEGEKPELNKIDAKLAELKEANKALTTQVTEFKKKVTELEKENKKLKEEVELVQTPPV